MDISVNWSEVVVLKGVLRQANISKLKMSDYLPKSKGKYKKCENYKNLSKNRKKW